MNLAQSTAREELDNPVYQAFQIPHVGFTVAPIIAGVDK